MIPKLSPLLAFVLLAPETLATDVWYRDTDAISPNGRFVATGKSPENRKKHPRPFQRNFAFKLRDTEANRTLWEFATGEEGEPGGSLYVSDKGLVVRLGAFENLWLIRPEGEQIALGNVFDHLPKSEVDAFCDRTTAGTFWSQLSSSDFVAIDGRDYFYIRTYWGRYIVIDLEKATISNAKSLERKLETQLVRKAHGILSLERNDLWSTCESCGGRHPSTEVARFLMILELHRISGRDRIIEAFGSVEDNHMHDVVEHIGRLRKR
jgi:hypothetical protein